MSNSSSKRILNYAAMLLVLLTKGAFASPFSRSHDFIKGISLYHRGDAASMKEAYTHLERVMTDPHATPEQLIGCSFILAYAPSSLLKSHKRHFYADYYLRNSPKANQGKNRSPLLRIAGDGFFDEKKFDLAVEYYQELATSPDLRNQAYAVYRLGWIDLNQQLPIQAWNRWMSFLGEHGRALLTTDSELVLSMVRDLGRAWSETAETAQTLPRLSPKLSEGADTQFKFLKEDPGAEAAFAEGIALGLKRLGRPEWIAKIHAELAPSPHYKNVLALLLEKKILFSTFPCEISRWVSDASTLDPVIQTTTFELVNRCAQRVVEKKECQTENGKLISNLYETFTLKDTKLLPRISYAIGCEQWETSCRDLIQFTQSVAESKSSRLEPEQMSSLFQACGQLDKYSESLQSKFRVLLDLYLQKGLLKPERNDVVNQLALRFETGSDFRVRLLSDMVQSQEEDKEKYKATVLPEMLLSLASDGEILKVAPAYLASFGQLPLSSTSLRVLTILVQDKMTSSLFTEVRTLLTQYLPMQKSVAEAEEQTELWEFYWLGLDPAGLEQESAAISQWVHFLPLAQLKPGHLVRTFAIALHANQFEFLWKNWTRYKKGVATQPGLKNEFFKKSLDLLAQKQLLPEALGSSADGKLLVRIFQEDPRLDARSIKEVLATDDPILSDYKALDALKALGKKIRRSRLKLNVHFLNLLKSKLNLLQKQRELLGAAHWSSPGNEQKAHDLVKKDATAVVEELGKIQKTIANQEELADLRQNLEEISSQIRGQIQDQIQSQIQTQTQSETQTKVQTEIEKGQAE